jgi:hypothetical protein
MRTVTPENLKKAADVAGDLILTGLGGVGKFINGVVTSGATTDFG